MRIACFSSFTWSEADRARLLFEQVRRLQPTWALCALIAERYAPLEGDAVAESVDEVTYAGELVIPSFDAWIFQSGPREACAALNGIFFYEKLLRGYDVVIHLAPECAVLGALEGLLACLGDGSILTTRATGIIAVRATRDGLGFARRWRDLLVDEPDSRIPLMVDAQRVLHDPRYNVEPWDGVRRVSIERDGAINVDGSPLLLWNFDGFAKAAGRFPEAIAANPELLELWNWYQRMVAAGVKPDHAALESWSFARFDDGAPVEPAHRTLYQRNREVRRAYPHPFDSGAHGYRAWLRSPAGSEALAAISSSRESVERPFENAKPL